MKLESFGTVGIAGVAMLALWLAGCATAPQRDATPADLSLPVPSAAGDCAYLGLDTDADRFFLQDVECEVLFVDCFDMYCHSCHSNAKRVNALYRLVQDRGLGDRIKFIGLGLNNTPLEVSTFHRKFDVPFPVFPDRSRDVADQFGRARLPSLLVICNRTPALRLIHQHNGTLTDVAGFLEHILEEIEQDCPQHDQDLVHPIQDCERGVCDPPPAGPAAG